MTPKNKLTWLFICVFVSATLIILGLTFNTTAVIENRCKMPVQSPFKYETSTHFSFQDPKEVNYYTLTDIIQIKSQVWSIGDLMMIGGLILFTFSSIFCVYYVVSKRYNLVKVEVKK